MKINWKLRLQNKVTLTALCMTLITAVYSVLATFGVTPSITQEQVTNLVIAIIAVLVSVGVVADPTTSGLSDSETAMDYVAPARDTQDVSEDMEVAA